MMLQRIIKASDLKLKKGGEGVVKEIYNLLNIIFKMKISFTRGTITFTKIIATVSGRFLMKEKFCLISPPWFAYGLLLATKQAKKYKLGVTAIGWCS